MENHQITIDNREKIIITQVADVDAFDEETLWANLKEGAIEISGEKLNVEKLDLSDGTLVISGRINSIIYIDTKQKSRKGLLRALTKRRIE